MSVVTMQTIDKPASPQSGSGMDRVVVRRGLSRNLKIAIGAIVVIAAAIAFYLLAPAANSQTIAADRITVSTVQKGRFDDFLPLRARVTPLLTVYLDAVEGGRVEKVLVEDGAMVQQGQLLAILSNSDLQLNLLARQSDVSREVNSMRSQELALAQTQIQDERAVIEAQLAVDKARRQYELQKPLMEKGFIPARTFQDSRDEYLSNQRRADALRRGREINQRLQGSQLAQLRASNASLSGSLDIARATLDALNLRAPVTGQLTAFSIQVGQSLSRGERLGQIDSAGRNKIVASVDEFYLGRVEAGQTATVEVGGKTFRAKVAKIYPQVRNGAFEVDLHFLGGEPPALQRGQTLQVRLTLGDPAPALLIPNGAFYNETGGSWVFVVAPDGGSAVKRNVRLGRRNADHIEVLEGLDPGERVITSPYTGFADRDRLDLDS
ncbi:efflux RND transporter periplasmic adaptor subunit [Allosphingosinicella deserti]|uniref:Efflux transporter periplasmic adaptor subunit n=1 Tax=Allosphingosinicella deserti TaxID=2116704 RepID=A0A2P7QFM0_9SPHN|nr:efflux RND transporter periplasmic adaptor subunit [Sphingomonas deserti]PSJ36753.1 efflux transporter periplasmic adaptor subunit [Sphingomonas deserti]